MRNYKRVALLGPKFTYSYNVTEKVFRSEIESGDVEITYHNNIRDIVRDVANSEDSIGMVPIENIVGGTVRDTMLALKRYKVKIIAGYDLGIHHCLASQSENFDKIISHPQSIMQCSEFLREYREKGIEILECSSNSKAMQIAKEDSSYGAIGPVNAAENNNLEILKKNIEDNENNVTRFLLISKNENSEDRLNNLKNAKTSMILEPKVDRAGLLFEILAVFKIKDINLTKIESIPTGEKLGTYIFYIDIDGNLIDKDVEDAINFLKTIVNVYLFGSYEVIKVD
jgi:prephenate dehydratase